MKTHNHWTEYSNAPEKHLTKNMQFTPTTTLNTGTMLVPSRVSSILTNCYMRALDCESPGHCRSIWWMKSSQVSQANGRCTLSSQLTSTIVKMPFFRSTYAIHIRFRELQPHKKFAGNSGIKYLTWRENWATRSTKLSAKCSGVSILTTGKDIGSDSNMQVRSVRNRNPRPTWRESLLAAFATWR